MEKEVLFLEKETLIIILILVFVLVLVASAFMIGQSRGHLNGVRIGQGVFREYVEDHCICINSTIIKHYDLHPGFK